MVYLHFPPNLMEEEMMLQAKYEKLKRKKKAVQNLKAPRPEPERIGQTKRLFVEARDAREYARKLIKSGAIAAIQKVPRREEQAGFKRPINLERKLERSERPLSGYQPFSSTQPDDFDPNDVRCRTKLYDPSSGPPVRERCLEIGDRVEKLKEPPKEGNTIYVSGQSITEEFLRKTFGSCGKIINITMEIEKNRGFVTFDKKEAAGHAISEFQSSVVSGIHLKVTYARRQPVVDTVNGAHSAAAWSSAASNNSQKGSYKETREKVDYSDDIFF